jgi:hypothetical protein
VVTLVARNATRLWWRLWWGLAEHEFGTILEFGQACIRASGRNLASSSRKVLSHLIYFANTYYKFCTFNAICKFGGPYAACSLTKILASMEKKTGEFRAEKIKVKRCKHDEKV